MRDETRDYMRRFGVDERIRSNIANLRDTLLIAKLYNGEFSDQEIQEQSDFILRALDLIESKHEEMLEIYARNFESIFSGEETRAILKYQANLETLEQTLLDELRSLFRPLLRAHRLEPDAGLNRVVEVRSKAELDRELESALDKTVALFGKRKKAIDA